MLSGWIGSALSAASSPVSDVASSESGNVITETVEEVADILVQNLGLVCCIRAKIALGCHYFCWWLVAI